MEGKKFSFPDMDLSVYTPVFPLFANDLVHILAGGRKPDVDWLKNFFGLSGGEIYCADRGAVYCLEAGLTPAAVYGDGDSWSEHTEEELAVLGIPVYKYPSAKDLTDLQIILNELQVKNLTVSGIWGGRFDHLYSAVYSLLAYKIKNTAQVIMADEKESMILLTEGEEAEIYFKDRKPSAISLLPLSDRTEVTLSNVRWPLTEKVLKILHPYAVSNTLAGQPLRCTCIHGCVGVYIFFE